MAIKDNEPAESRSRSRRDEPLPIRSTGAGEVRRRRTETYRRLSGHPGLVEQLQVHARDFLGERLTESRGRLGFELSLLVTAELFADHMGEPLRVNDEVHQEWVYRLQTWGLSYLVRDELEAAAKEPDADSACRLAAELASRTESAWGWAKGLRELRAKRPTAETRERLLRLRGDAFNVVLVTALAKHAYGMLELAGSRRR